jgi:hypothetical protein
MEEDCETMIAETDAIRQIEFELEKAERGMAMPYDAERVGRLRKMLVEARKRKLSEGLARLRTRGKARPNLLTSPCPMADAAITGASARAARPACKYR